METTYTYKAGLGKRSGSQVRRGARNHNKRGVSLAPKECRRLVQLCVCAALFVVVFLGQGIFPGRLEGLRTELLTVIQSDTDFRAAFESLGRSVSQGEPVSATLGGLWTDILSGGEKTTPVVMHTGKVAALTQDERDFLASNPEVEEVMARRFGVTEQQREVPATTPPIAEIPAAVPETTLPPTLPAQPAPVYTGVAMPEGATMEEVDLGIPDTVSPVVAAMASGYGWREHPIAGGEKFHSGVDLAADYGSPIGAFADGVVDYIGESPAYGQYVQLKHAGGVTTFYAHCSKLCVQPGQQVTVGETVAEVGNTGNVTGTHLHFELKQNGEFLNPLYYIEILK